MTGPPVPESRLAGHGAAALLTLAGLTLSIVLALLSDGVYHDDGLAHYLYARWAWNDPEMLVDVWGRAGMTALYCLPARLGWPACRIESGLLSAGAAWCAYLTARRLGMPRAALVPMLTWIQPLFLALSYDTFTETAVTFYLAFALWLFACRRFTASAAVLSLCFITRYETAVLVAVWCFALRQASARWFTYAALVTAPLAHHLITYAVMGRWLFQIVLAGPHLIEYGAGTPLSMLLKSLVACGPSVGVLAMIGAITQKSKSRSEKSKGLTLGLVAALYLTHLVTHSVLYWRGVFSSGGYARFFVSTAPLAAILALAAINHFVQTDRFRQRRALVGLVAIVLLTWIGVEIEPPPRDEVWLLVYRTILPLTRAACAVVVIAAAIAMIQSQNSPARRRRGIFGLLAALGLASMAAPWAYLIKPHRLTLEAKDIAAAVQWLRDEGLANRPLITTNVWTSYFNESERNVTAVPSQDPLAGARAGTLLLWDGHYSPSERFGISLDGLEKDNRWRLLWTSPPRWDGELFARIYSCEPVSAAWNPL